MTKFKRHLLGSVARAPLNCAHEQTRLKALAAKGDKLAGLVEQYESLKA